MTDLYPMIDLSPVFWHEDMSLKAIGHAIASRIRGSEWYHDTPNKNLLASALTELEDAGNDVWMFDQAWDKVYNLADADGVLIIIMDMEDHQNERG